MPFPKTSLKYQSHGRHGTLASENPVVYAVGSPIAGGKGVICGAAVWVETSTDKQGIYNPVEYSNTGTGDPVGIALATIQSPIYSGEATMQVSPAQPVTVVVKGDLFMKAADDATVGQKAFANLTTGAITFAAAGATVAGAVETSWKVILGGSAGDNVIISNWME